MLRIPASLVALGAGRDDWQRWLATLPRVIDGLLADWVLEPVGAPLSGQTAVVVPVRTEDGRDAMLKVGWPHEEAEHEHLALRAWDGHGAVRLYRADPHRWALLLERADPARDLHSIGVVEACEVVAELYERLHRPAIPQLRRLSVLCGEWSERLPALATSGIVPRRFVTEAVALTTAFARDPGTDGVLVHTDLHYQNVLAADRGPWLAIDPKPLSGDPAYEVAPLLWNRWDEAVASGSIRRALLARLFAAVDAAGLDEDRVRDWIVVRELVNIMWAHEDQVRGRPLDEDWITIATTIVKAIR